MKLKAPTLALLVSFAQTVLPLVGIVYSLRTGVMPWAIMSVLFLIGSAVSAAGIAREKPWGRRLAEYVSMTELVGSAMYFARFGASPSLLWALPNFAGYSLLLATKPKEAKVDGEPAPSDRMDLVRENAESIVVALIMAQLIITFCGGIYEIPSASMEPTLMAPHNGQPGDRVMVLKNYYVMADIERYDIAVFRAPLNPMKNLIKRVVGLPDEDLYVNCGNIYTRPHGSKQPLRLQRKPLKIQRSVWIDVFLQPPMMDQSTFDEHFKTEETTRHPVINGELSATDSRFTAALPDATSQNEVCFDADVETGGSDFSVQIRHDAGVFDLAIGATSRLRRGDQVIPGTITWGNPGTYHHLEFMVYDGAVVVIVDGRVQIDHTFATDYDPNRVTVSVSGLSFGASHGTFKVSDLRVGRDIFHKVGELDITEDLPLVIPADSYVMMGDNVNSSYDSRSWKKMTYHLKGGRTVVCENYETRDQGENGRKYTQHTGLPAPDVVIAADEHSIEQAFNNVDLDSSHKLNPESVPAPFVDRKYIIGRAFVTIWPPARWFRLVR